MKKAKKKLQASVPGAENDKDATHQFKLIVTVNQVEFTVADKKWKPENLVVEWKRGARVVNTKSITLEPNYKGKTTATWEEELVMIAHLNRKDDGTFEKKDYKFTLQDVRGKKGTKDLGYADINLAAFVDMDGNYTKEDFPVSVTSTKISQATITLTITSAFVQSKVRDDDEISIMSAVSFGNRNRGNDSEDEDEEGANDDARSDRSRKFHDDDDGHTSTRNASTNDLLAGKSVEDTPKATEKHVDISVDSIASMFSPRKSDPAQKQTTVESSSASSDSFGFKKISTSEKNEPTAASPKPAPVDDHRSVDEIFKRTSVSASSKSSPSTAASSSSSSASSSSSSSASGAEATARSASNTSASVSVSLSSKAADSSSSKTSERPVERSPAKAPVKIHERREELAIVRKDNDLKDLEEEELREELAALQADFDKLLNRNQELIRERNDLEAHAQELEDELHDVERKHDQDNIKRSAELQTAKETIEELRTELRELSTSGRSERSRDIELLQIELTEVRAESDKFKSTVSELEGRIEELLSENERLHNLLEEAEVEKAKAIAETVKTVGSNRGSTTSSDSASSPAASPTSSSSSSSSSASASVAVSAGNPNDELCVVCKKKIYPVERLSTGGKDVYHKECFRCAHCHTLLRVTRFSAVGGKVYCKPHFDQLFKIKGNYSGGFEEDGGAPVSEEQQAVAPIVRSTTPTAGAGSQDDSATFKDLKAKADRLESNNKKLNQEAMALEASNRKLTHELESLREELRGLRSGGRSHISGGPTSSSSSSAGGSGSNGVNLDDDSVTWEAESNFRIFNEEKNKLEQENFMLQEQLEKLRVSHLEISDELRKLKAEYSTEENRTAEERIKRLKKDLANSRDVCAEIMKKYEQLLVFTKQQPSKGASLSKAFSGLYSLGGKQKPQTVEQLSEELRVLDDRYYELTQQLVQVRLQLMTHLDEVKELREENKDLLRVINEEKTKRLDLQKKLTKYEVKLAG